MIRICENLDFSDYWSDPAVSSSTLKKFLIHPTPAHVKYAIENPKDDNDALLCGRVLHSILLEPHTLDTLYVIEREKLRHKTKLEKNGGTKEAWDKLKAESDSRIVPLVSHELWATAKGMADNIESMDIWTPLSKYGKKELSIFAKIRNQAVKARLDLIFGSHIFDIKSTRHTLTDDKISKIILDERYHLSAAMYMDVANAAGIEASRFSWIFVENFPPYLCRIIEAPAEMIAAGRNELQYCLRKWKAASDGYWPGYDHDASYATMPAWYRFEGKL